MSGVCKKHERYIPEGEECPYCEAVTPEMQEASLVLLRDLPDAYVPIYALPPTPQFRGWVLDEPSPLAAVRLAAAEEMLRAGNIDMHQAIGLLLAKEKK